MRTCFVKGALTGGGEGGRIEEYDWDGNLVWAFDYSTADYMSHHDIEPLPNGNILMLVVEKKTYAEVLAAGFNPDLMHPDVESQGSMMPDSVVEIEPQGTDGGTVVWSWHVWDHLIQDFDANQDNYDVVAERPELIDVNGYVEKDQKTMPFWNHMNSIDYNADLDQIMLSVRGSSELWVIDHSTTTAQAAGSTGGNSGKGGGLLYRWGNPQTYDAGTAGDQTLFDQHDAQWIETGNPGERNILIFNNGLGRNYSTVDEIVPPIDEEGNYALATGEAYEPGELAWTYAATPPTDLYSEAISGVQRLPNGNTLICDGVHGMFREVTSDGTIVWQYINPVTNTGPLMQGELPTLDVRKHNYNAVFKIHRYSPTYPGLDGKDLTPTGLVELAAGSSRSADPVQPQSPERRSPQGDGPRQGEQPPQSNGPKQGERPPQDTPRGEHGQGNGNIAEPAAEGRRPGGAETLQKTTELRYWNETQAYNGYTLFASRGTSYLIDMEGSVVHTWNIGTNPRLLDNGRLLDASTDDPSGFAGFQELDWDGNIVWSYLEERADYAPHHDFVRIFNQKLGEYTTLYIANKSLSQDECIAAGCDPAKGPYDESQIDAVVEVDMNGNIVWEWWFFDHVVQDIDPTKDNYVGQGLTIAETPGKLNLNLPGRPVRRDWLHCNSLDYNQELGQIVINSVQGEFYVIDHDATFVPNDPDASITLAAGDAGDFLYRFGDPARYEQGDPPSILEDWTASTTGHKQIGGSHDIHWIDAGLPGAGNFLIFNNGQYLFERTPQSYIMEINGYLDQAGTDTGDYVNPPDAGYYKWESESQDTHKAAKNISNQIAWMYYSKSNQAFFSHIGSGAQRLPNGNTLICAMTEGHIFEITADGDLVWEYINPVTNQGIVEALPDSYPMTNAVFRAYRYTADHPALDGRELTPLGPITTLSEGEQADNKPRPTDPKQPASQEPSTQATAGNETCIAHTVDDPECKDCCDMLEADGQTRKECRDTCAVHDFGQNTQFIPVDVVSILGPEGDYSMCTTGSDEQTCKNCCDSSDDLAGGDRQFCRNACAH